MNLSLQKLTYLTLWLTVFTVPIQKHFIIPGVGSLNKVVGIILLIIAMVTILKKGSIKKLSIFYLLSTVFVFLNISSFFWAEVPKDAISKSILFIQVIFLAWSISEFAETKEKLNNLFKAYLLGCLVIAVQTIYQYSTSVYTLMSDARFFIDGYNPNALSIMWALGIPMAVHLTKNQGKIFILYIPLAAYSILLTGSRTGVILLILSLFATVWFLFKYKARFKTIITSCLIVSSVIAIQLLPEAQLSRLSTLSNELSDGTLNGRTNIWDVGIETFSKSPILGVGAGSFLEASAANSILETPQSAHNSYLSILVENGLLGFMVFFLMLCTLVIFGFKTRKESPYRWLIFTLLSMWLVLSFASHAEAQKYTWVIFGIIVASYSVEKKESFKHKDDNKELLYNKVNILKKRIVW